jgi:hypothetical protein
MRALTKLRIDEVSCVIKGANPGAQVLIRKSDDTPLLFDDVMKQRRQQQWVEQHYALSKADEPRDDADKQRANDDNKVSSKLRDFAAALIVSMPGLTEEKALQFIIHTPHGRKMFEHFSKQREQTMPQVDISKLIPVIEEGLLARAKLTKRDGQSEAQAFAKLYEADIEFRKSWVNLTEVKHQLALSKSMPNMMSLEPTMVGGKDATNVNDPAEAVRLLNEMAERQHRTFEEVFLDQSNAELAARTYRPQHRPTASSTSGSELQR